MSAALSPRDRLSEGEVLNRVSAALPNVKGTVWVLTFASDTSPVVMGMHEQLQALGRAPIQREFYILEGTQWRHPPVALWEYRPTAP